MRRSIPVLSSFVLAAATFAPGVAHAFQTPAHPDVRVTLQTDIDSRHAVAGMPVMAAIHGKSMFGGTEVPKGAMLVGHVTAATAKSPGNPDGSVSLVFDQMRMKDGTVTPLHATIHDVTQAPSVAEVDAADIRSVPNSNVSTHASASGAGSPALDSDGDSAGPVAVGGGVDGDGAAAITARGHNVHLRPGTQMTLALEPR